MEKVTSGLSVEELETQRVELLPDRIELHKGHRGHRFKNFAVSGVTFTQGDVIGFNFEAAATVTPPAD